MKKLISVILCSAMLLGVFIAFPMQSHAYSGGRGTETSPYLISTANDLYELLNMIETEPLLWSKKVYYELINDITISRPISPLYKTSGVGFNCYVDSYYDLTEEMNDLSFNESWYPSFQEKYGDLYSVYEPYVSTVGYLAKRYSRIDDSEELTDLGERLFPSRGEGGYTSYNPSSTSRDLYRKVAFTGVFDGNGYSITTRGYVFGFVENGAVIKDLTVKGSNAGLAYSVSADSTVAGCAIDSEWSYTDDVFAGEYFRDDGPYGYDLYNVYEVISGGICYNYGTVENCVNYANGIAGLVGTNYGTVKNCMNFGTVYSRDAEEVKNIVPNISSPYLICCDWPVNLAIDRGESCVDLSNSEYTAADDTVYTLDECVSAGGDKSAFEGLDFLCTWVMIEGMPYLRRLCEAQKGDLNFDGVVNGKDANQLKAVIAHGTEGYDYRTLAAFDIKLDGTIDAKDANILKQMIIG